MQESHGRVRASHPDPELLRESFYALGRMAAQGIDGVTWNRYEVDPDARLKDLHQRIQRGVHRAQLSKRVFIPKTDGKLRPLGIAALEDKVVQQAVVTVLNLVHEVDFPGSSYGFRPQRGAHDALDVLWVGLMRKKLTGCCTQTFAGCLTPSTTNGCSSFSNTGSPTQGFSA
jgi:retron-type reverse transcriptase